MKREFISSSPSQTKKIARSLAPRLRQACLSARQDFGGQALIIALSGELGSGKTTFLQGFAKGLGIKEKILSPTFVIMKKFPKKRNRVPSKRNSVPFLFYFYHIDCYRVEKSKELLDLGFKKLSSNPENIIAIEWPEKIKKILPKNTLWLKFEFINEKTRKITIKQKSRNELFQRLDFFGGVASFSPFLFYDFLFYATIKKW